MHQRWERTSAAIKEEMWRECTFTPQIKDLPPFYGPQQELEPFYARVLRWKEAVKEDVEQMKEQAADSDIVECTFHPTINRNSRRAVLAMRTGVEPVNANERLYKQVENIKVQRRRLAEEYSMRALEEEKRECTFAPQLHPSPKYKRARSKFMTEMTIASNKQREESFMSDYTFAPKIKGVSKGMTAAKMYLENPVVERLTRTYSCDDMLDKVGESDILNSFAEDRPTVDAKSFMNSVFKDRPSSAPKERNRSANNTASDHFSSPEHRERRRRNFQAFLARQQYFVTRRENRTKEIREHSKPPFQPQLCRKANDIQIQSTFEDRLNRDEARRKREAERKKVVNEPECSFTPQTTSKAARMRPRSVYELSRGDMMKRENARRLMRLRFEQGETRELTFRPSLTAAGEESSGRVGSNHDIEKYVRIIKEIQKKRAEAAARLQHQRQESELSSCTFTPTIIECPTYVQRISQSMKMAKSIRSQEVSYCKPDWR